MNNAFEDRLWDALKHEAERPEHELPADRFRARPARRPVGARQLSLGLAVAATIATVLALVPGSGSTPAYAVEVQKDGAVKITANEAGKATLDQDQMKALQFKLRKADINVILDASVAYSCRFTGDPRDRITLSPPRPDRNLGSVMYRSDSPRAHVVVLHPGETAWIESGLSDKGGRVYSIALLSAICAPAHDRH